MRILCAAAVLAAGSGAIHPALTNTSDDPDAHRKGGSAGKRVDARRVVRFSGREQEPDHGLTDQTQEQAELAAKYTIEDVREPDSVSIVVVDTLDIPVPKAPGTFLTGQPSASQAPVLEVEPNDSASSATPLGGPNVVGKGSIYRLGNGPLAANGDSDYWSFDGVAGDRVYAATMTSGGAPSSDTTLVLLGTDGTTILETDLDDGSLSATSSSIAGAELPATGTYYLQVGHATNASRIAPYFIHFRLQSGSPMAEVEPNDTPASATPLPASGWVSGARDPALATEQDWFSFSANAGDTVFLGLDLDPERDEVSWNGRLGIGMFGDAGNQVIVVDDSSTGSGSNPLSEAMMLTVKNTGTYFVLVDSASASTGGPGATYHLSVGIHPATPIGTNCTIYTSADVPRAIGPGAATTDSTITIPGNPRIGDLNVSITLDHAVMSEVDASLINPAGSETAIFTDIGSTSLGGETQLDLDFDDEAATPPLSTVLKGFGLQPEAAYRLTWLKGESAGGTWTLRLRDDAANTNGGNLTAWSMTLCQPPPPPVCAGTPVTVLDTGFELDNGGFTVSAGPPAPWQHGTPTAAPIATCSGGIHCWKTNLSGAYSAGANQELISPSLDLSGLGAPITVTWSQKYQMESASFDTFWLGASDGGPGNAAILFQFLDENMFDSLGSPPVAINEPAGWGVMTRDMSSYAGRPAVQLRWGFVSDGSGQYAGVALDDLAVTACCTASSCDDGNPCTDDVCDAQGGCMHINNDTNICSDGNLCTAPDSCSNGACVPGPNPCEDNNACTAEVCDGQGGCAHAPITCDDANPCTDDACEPATGCAYVDNTLHCSDGDPCTTADRCAAGVCVPGGPPAPLRFCGTGGLSIPSKGTATPYPSPVSVSAGPLVCSVDVELNGVTHTYPDDIDILLSSPAAVNAIIMSDVGGAGPGASGVNLTLSDGAAAPLPDAGPLTSGTFRPNNVGAGDPFTAPAPAPLGGSALSIFNGTNPNGTWDLWVLDDTTGDLGSISGWCVDVGTPCGSMADCDDGNPCTSDSCDPQTGDCVHTGIVAACEDGDACTTGDVCVNGSCQPGAPTVCDDGNVCTDDQCDPLTGACAFSNNAIPCDDGLACTTGDVCVGGSCQPGTPVVCDDTNVCTDDQCDPATGYCVFSVNSAGCDDGESCTIGDFCSAGFCQPGAPTSGPMEVTGVIMAIDTMTLTWPAVATATRYDVVRGSTTALPVGPGGGDEACFAGLTDTLLFDATNPAAGGGSFYLVRSASACGVSTFGTQSNGALRATTTCP